MLSFAHNAIAIEKLPHIAMERAGLYQEHGSAGKFRLPAMNTQQALPAVEEILWILKTRSQHIQVKT